MYDVLMRTTLSIGDDVLAAARDIASAQNRPLGDVVTDLARRGLRRTAPPLATRNGIPLLPTSPDNAVVTSALVNELRDDNP